MSDLSPARLAEIEQRLNAAPRGQLSAVGTTIFKQNLIDDIEIAECYSKETAAFFCGTPDDIRDLLAEVRRLRAMVPTLHNFNPEKHMVCKKPPHTCLRCRQRTVVLAEWEGDRFKDGFKWTCKNCGEVTYS